MPRTIITAAVIKLADSKFILAFQVGSTRQDSEWASDSS